MTLLDQISEALRASGALGDLSNTLGSSAGETESLLSAGLPAILGGLGAQADGDGATALFGLLGDDSGSFSESIGSFFGHGDKTGLASTLIGSIFGSQRSAVESHVAGESRGAISMASRLLPLLAPAALGLLAKFTADDDLDADGLSAQLGTIGADGPLGDILESATDEDRAGFVTGIAALREAGGLGALIPAAGATPAAVAAGAGAGGAAVASLAGPADDGGDRTRSGLAWLLPVIAPLGLMIAGLVLWQCTSSNDVEQVVAAVEEADAEPEPTAAPEPEPTEAPEPEPTEAPEPEPTEAPEPAPTEAPEPEPTEPPDAEEPVITLADLAAGNAELSTLVSLATELGLTGVIDDPEAGPFTIFAPTNAAFEAAGGVLSRLDGDQTATAVSFHVVADRITSDQLVPGAQFTTLAGETITIGDDGSLPGGTVVVTSDLMADNGVVHVVESVLVPGSIQRFLATEDVNTLFQLDPIQFASGSAEILAESIPTLDAAVETLLSIPAGSLFEVQGHTDTDGGDAANQALSEARAASVVTYLTGNGVSADLLVPRGYGETVLKNDPELSPEDKAANRRIEFEDISGE